MDSLFSFLFEKWPYAVWIGLGGIIVSFYYTVRGKAEEAHSKIDNLPCDSHKEILNKQNDLLVKYGEKINTVESLHAKIAGLPCDARSRSHSELKEGMIEVRTSIGFIRETLDAMNKNMQSNSKIINPYSQRSSPLSITKEGYELERIGLDDMIDNNWSRISYYINEQLKSRNPYDIQQFINEHIVVYPLKFIKENELDKIKSVAYSEGFHLMVYLTVLSIIIRDRYFNERGIDIDEVDKDDFSAVVSTEKELQ